MTRHEVLVELQRRLDQIPPLFADDGCSGVADWWFGSDLRPACRVHDFWYCTRGWPAGTLDQAHRHDADAFLGRSVRALLPLGLGWIGWFWTWFVHRYGGDESYDSCGPEAGKLCRHRLFWPENR